MKIFLIFILSLYSLSSVQAQTQCISLFSKEHKNIFWELQLQKAIAEIHNLLIHKLSKDVVEASIAGQLAERKIKELNQYLSMDQIIFRLEAIDRKLSKTQKASPTHDNATDSNDRIQLLMFLNEHGFKNVEDTNSKGDYPILLAAKLSREDIILELLKNGANPNRTDKNGNSALMIVIKDGNINTIEYLLQNKADPNLNDNKGKTALLLASEAGRSEIVDLLLKYKADPNKVDKDLVSPLMCSSNNGNLVILTLLLEKGAHIDAQDKHGETPLIKATKMNNFEIFKKLVDEGANLDLTNKNLQSSLMISAQRGFDDIAGFLIQKNANFTNKDKFGYTTLYYAKYFHRLGIVKLLERRGAIE